MLPCRDAAETLPETIASLRAQSYRDFTVAAVDDGSTDATGAILADWAGDDPRVTVISRPAESVTIAANHAIAASRSPLIARMDADDIAHPRRFEVQLDYMRAHPDLAGCGTHVEMFSSNEVGSGYRRYERWINAVETTAELERAVTIESPIANPSMVIKASVLRALGGYRDVGWPEDYDLVLRVIAAGARLANVPGEPLLRWRIRPDRLSLTAKEYNAAAFRRCRVHFLREVFLPPGRPIVVWGAGKVGKPIARELIRQGTTVTGFVDLDPRKIGQEIHGASVWSPDEFGTKLESKSQPYVLAAVGTPGVRDEIRKALDELGLDEITDYRFCA
jgi:glycosyltransferase involved in cell wall biosynthesis